MGSLVCIARWLLLLRGDVVKSASPILNVKSLPDFYVLFNVLNSLLPTPCYSSYLVQTIYYV